MKQRAFTLIELLVVIAIIGVIASIVFVNLKGTREKARLTKGLQFGQSVNHALGAYAIGVWDFNEGTGDIARDRSGFDNDLDLSGTWVTGLGGKGSAYQLAGGGWVTTNFTYGIGLAITYEFWFKLPSTGDTQGTFLCTEDISDTSIEDNLVQANYGNESCSTWWNHPGFNVSDTNWHHFVFSKSVDSQLCLDAECESVGDATGNVPNIGKIILNGGCGCGEGGFSNGIIIDELRIYEEPLSTAQIQKHYAEGLERIKLAEE